MLLGGRAALCDQEQLCVVDNDHVGEARRRGDSERLRVMVLVVLAVCPGDRVWVELDVHVGVDEEVSVLVKERGSE